MKVNSVAQDTKTVCMIPPQTLPRKEKIVSKSSQDMPSRPRQQFSRPKVRPRNQKPVLNHHLRPYNPYDKRTMLQLSVVFHSEVHQDRNLKVDTKTESKIKWYKFWANLQYFYFVSWIQLMMISDLSVQPPETFRHCLSSSASRRLFLVQRDL